MKRLSVVLLCLFLFTACFQAAAGAINIESGEAYPLQSGDSINANSVSIWGNYIFASTVDNGLEIIDMETNSVIAKWNLASTDIIPGLGSFASVQTVVTDEYIICANNVYVVVFPNEGKYSDTPPQALVRITPNPSNAKRTFNQLKRMFVHNGFLYLFDLTATNQVDAVSKHSDMAVVWKVPLSSFENIDYKYDAFKWASLEEMPGVEFACLGNYQYFWETIKIDEENAYCVTYNDELLMPKKTLFLNVLNLDTLESESGEILKNNASGLQTTFVVEGSVTMEEIRDMELYVARVEETERVPLSLFLDVDNTEYLMVDIDEADGKSTVKLMFSADVISPLVDIFDCGEDQIVNNGIVFATDYDGVTHEFVYITNDSCYDSGVIALDRDRNIGFVMTGAVNTDNLIISTTYSNDEIKLLGSKIVTPIGDYNIAVDAVCAQNELIALYKGVSSRAAVYDTSSPANIPYNFSRSLQLGSGIYLSNTLSAMVHYGNKYYYADTLGKNIAVLNTDETATFAKIYQKEGEMPVRVYGYSSEYDTVKVVLDDEAEVMVPVTNGLWSYTVAMTANGEHTIDVEIGGYSEHFDYTVDVPLPVTVDAVDYSNDGELKATFINDTNKYENSLQTTNIKAVAVLYDEEGGVALISEQNKEIAFGESEEIIFSEITDLDVEDANGEIKFYILNEALAPLSMAYTYSGGTLSDAEVPTVTGKISSISAEDEIVDANNKTITLKGHVNCDGTRPVVAVISFDGFVYDVIQTVCDEDGNFSITYYYGNDSIDGEGTYDIKINAMMGGTQNAIEDEITIMDSDVFNEKLTYINENIESGEALLGYLRDNTRFSREAGMNLGNADFVALSEIDKISVMDKALDIIKNGDRTTLFDVFSSESARLKQAADVAKAIKEINNATKATIFGVLKNNKGLIGMSDDLWNEYEGLGKKISTANSKLVKLIKGNITSLSEVEGKLESAIDYAKNNEEPSSDKVSSKGDVGGYKVPTQPIEITPVNPEDVYNPDEVSFKDLGDVKWAEEAIVALAKKGILAGVSPVEFRPNDGVTREQFVKMLVIAFGLEDNTAKSSFKDVDENAWYYKYVAAAEKCGLTKGNGENFGIGQVITREEMATLAYRAANITGKTLPVKNEEQIFNDANEIAEYAQAGISAMQKAGIIHGVGDGKFAPKAGCTRAMAAKVVYELLNI